MSKKLFHLAFTDTVCFGKTECPASKQLARIAAAQGVAEYPTRLNYTLYYILYCEYTLIVQQLINSQQTTDCDQPNTITVLLAGLFFLIENRNGISTVP